MVSRRTSLSDGSTLETRRQISEREYQVKLDADKLPLNTKKSSINALFRACCCKRTRHDTLHTKVDDASFVIVSIFKWTDIRNHAMRGETSLTVSLLA